MEALSFPKNLNLLISFAFCFWTQNLKKNYKKTVKFDDSPEGKIQSAKNLLIFVLILNLLYFKFGCLFKINEIIFFTEITRTLNHVSTFSLFLI